MNRQRGSRPFWGRFLKRAIDIVGASILSAVLLPVMAGVAALVWLFLGRPVFFLQKRSGLGGRIFTIWKFRTMTSATGSDGRPLADAARLTPFGRLLRQTSLDELPQLLQVLRGEMSLVGPRPLLPEYLDRYTPEQARRHEVKPGITGWCQVRGRNALSWEEKFRLDTWYVDHWSVPLDLSILLQTVLVVLRREGVSHGSDATMPEFLGTNEHIIPISRGRRMEPLVILGAGEFGREVAWLVDEINRAAPEPKWNLLGFLDDNPNALAEFSHYPPLLGRPETYGTLGRPLAVCAVANSGTREELVTRLDALGARWATLIHPTAAIGMGTQIGEGSILCRQAMVTVDATIGRHVQLNVNSAVGHDARLGDFCTLAGFVDICGRVVLERGVYVATHASVLPKTVVGAWAQISAGSTARRRVRPGMTVVGVPGKEFFFPGANVARAA